MGPGPKFPVGTEIPEIPVIWTIFLEGSDGFSLGISAYFCLLFLDAALPGRVGAT
jgi:hypothetical protein